jgi:hypothetical protein
MIDEQFPEQFELTALLGPDGQFYIENDALDVSATVTLAQLEPARLETQIEVRLSNADTCLVGLSRRSGHDEILFASISLRQ